MKTKQPLLLIVANAAILRANMNSNPAIQEHGSTLFENNELREYLIEKLGYETMTTSTPREVMCQAAILILKDDPENRPFGDEMTQDEFISLITHVFDNTSDLELHGAIKSWEWFKTYGVEITHENIENGLSDWVAAKMVSLHKEHMIYEMEINDRNLCPCKHCDEALEAARKTRQRKMDPKAREENEVMNMFSSIFGADLGQELYKDLKDRSKPNRNDIN